jgi:hypothetical protein
MEGEDWGKGTVLRSQDGNVTLKTQWFKNYRLIPFTVPLYSHRVFDERLWDRADPPPRVQPAL